MASGQQGDKSGEEQVLRVPREKIPPATPLSPEEALKAFRLQPGFRIELVAAEPLVETPVAMAFDPSGRLWVVEMRGFMQNADARGEHEPVGRITILEDRDGDGRMDRKTMFLDGLVLPRAIALVRDGALVAEPPKLWFCRDTNGDGKCDEKIEVAGDYGVTADPKLGARANPEHASNGLLWALDNWIYSASHTVRFRNLTGQWEREPTSERGQWGISQDNFGRLFFDSNQDQLRADFVPAHYRNPEAKQPGLNVRVAPDQAVFPVRVNPGINRGYREKILRNDGRLAKFTAACGPVIYRGDNFPSEFQGNAFVCEPAANLVKRNILDEKDGVITARAAYPDSEFLASTDERFRPVNACNGPDGALYIVDMYRGILQHRNFVTSYLRQQIEERGLEKPLNQGRIYRVAHEGKPPGGRPRLAQASPAELVSALSHPNGWWRDTAQRLLVERRDGAAVPLLQSVLRPPHSPIPFARLHALWTLDGMRQLDVPTLQGALGDEHPKIRAAALRLAESFLKLPETNSVIAALRANVLDSAADTNADVQTQLALTLGEITPDENTKELLARMARDSKAGLARDAAAFSIARRKPPKRAVASQADPLSPEEQKRFDMGKLVYEATCLACHQPHGMGQEGLAPPLVGSEWVTGPDQRLARIVLHGVRGPITVKKQTYELDMPALGIALDDDQVAAVLTYVRRQWGHTAALVPPATVKEIREKTAAREDAWTATELLKIP